MRAKALSIKAENKKFGKTTQKRQKTKFYSEKKTDGRRISLYTHPDTSVRNPPNIIWFWVSKIYCYFW